MQKKALVLALVCVMGLALVGSANAQAWYNCNINTSGAGWGQNYIVVTDIGGAFSSRTFILDDSAGKAKEMFAAVLTAQSMGVPLFIYLVDTSANSAVFGVQVSQ